ncbi:3'(2'),5'-bisphosphate nucleotidase CysQ [Zeaxanthinibacter sp. PT1]|uniref:3'(2'),5'-bisphosphate nucleotidase CysQ n=1 Tax=Zeaxanthinibacter TaxID=561554 RepID=UPI00234AF7DD|nr:3'(2'),5'-bisphosphate nucleotidase CysQ [Zeaxanthinibacter sp. PT1]MDC6352760.1 3'(2'),5'-bisphosphate nucleotidase CysQ [Zeaxanthinibacter sp. PT1]
MNALLHKAIFASIEAGKKIMEIYSHGFKVQRKEDDSPVTQADIAAEKIILEHLSKTRIPIISEESVKSPYSERQHWKHCWLVDPLDGTKEFIKQNGEFTVNIAYCERGQAVLGVIYVPVSGELYWGNTKENLAFKATIPVHTPSAEISMEHATQLTGTDKDPTILRVARSRSHLNTSTSEYIKSVSLTYEQIEMVVKGSSLKFGLLAEGEADLYPRFSPTMEWDTAAGHAICKAVGFEVIKAGEQSELHYNKEDLTNPNFIVRRKG